MTPTQEMERFLHFLQLTCFLRHFDTKNLFYGLQSYGPLQKKQIEDELWIIPVP
jgi:hypothetical protein